MNKKNIFYAVILAAAFGLFIYYLVPVLNKTHGSLTQTEALVIAESTPEVKALYRLQSGRYKDCIKKSVLASCDSDWVTCVEDVWVVQFLFDNRCGVKHDGRLGVTILVDALSGTIRSRFPEPDYFSDEKFCFEDYDCVYLLHKGREKDECLNFVHGQINKETPRDIVSEECACLENQCLLRN